MRTIRINPLEDFEMVEAIASVYQQSFGGEPWNEGYICPVCKEMFALTADTKVCVNCANKGQSIVLVEYWPINKIISDFYSEMKKSGSVCIVAQSENSAIVGFAWGYRVSANSSLDEYLEAPNVHKSLQGDFFYLDECALLPSFQGKGIGKLLVTHIFREQQQKQILLRTKNDSRMCNLIKHFGGETIQHISLNRVIMKLFVS